MEILFIILFIVIIVLVIRKARNDAYKRYRKGGTGYRRVSATKLEIDEENEDPFPDIDVDMYQKRHRVMTNSEATFFRIAEEKLPGGYYIFPKMRIADVIQTKNGRGYYKQRNKILPKHVDFLICNKGMMPICAIELDGQSHNTPKQRERDEMVEYIFESVGIPLERVRVGESFEKICEEMRQYLTQQ